MTGTRPQRTHTRFAIVALLVLTTGLLPLVSAQPALAEAEPPKVEGVEASASRLKATYRGEIFIPGDELVNNASMTGSKYGGGGGGCADCFWEFYFACALSGPGVDDAPCRGTAAGCDPGVWRFKIYLTNPPGKAELITTRCVGDGDVVERAAIEEAAQRAFKDLVPGPALPRIKQPSSPLIHLATYFQAEGKSTDTVAVGLDGLTLDVTATAEYIWNFGDGQTLTTRSPGRPYKLGDDPSNPPGASDAVMHWYRKAGAFEASLQTTWSGSYVFRGATKVLPPIVFPAVTLPLTVHEVRVTLYD